MKYWISMWISVGEFVDTDVLGHSVGLDSGAIWTAARRRRCKWNWKTRTINDYWLGLLIILCILYTGSVDDICAAGGDKRDEGEADAGGVCRRTCSCIRAWLAARVSLLKWHNWGSKCRDREDIDERYKQRSGCQDLQRLVLLHRYLLGRTYRKVKVQQTG